MAKIIQFDPNYYRNKLATEKFEQAQNHSPRPDTIKLCEAGQPDSFEYEEPDFDDTLPSLFSIQEVIKLAGRKKTDEIFETFLSHGKSTVAGKISPPTADVPLKESLSTIWGKNKDSAAQKRAKISELTRTKKAFLALEKEASRNLEIKSGKKVNIKISVQTEEDEKPLTDILDEQINFYKKGELAASVSLIGQKAACNFNNFLQQFRSKFSQD